MKTTLPIVLAVLLAIATTAIAVDPAAYVINTTGETLSRIDLVSGQVDNDIVTLGSDIYSYPSQIIVMDTLAYVINSGTDEIQIIDLSDETTIGFVNTGAGSNPYWMEFYDDRHAFVTLWVDGVLAKLDMVDGIVEGTWPVGDSPEGVLIHDHKVYVAVTAFNQTNWTFGQGKIVVFDARTEQVTAEIEVGTNPQYLARDGAGRIHVVCTGDYWSSFGMVYVIDPDFDSILDSFSTGGSPGNITIGADDIGYIAAGGWSDDGYVYSYDAGSFDVFHDVVNPLVVDSGCMMVVAHRDTSCFVGSFKDYVKPIDSAGIVLDAFAVGDGPVHTDFNYQVGDIDGNSVGPDIADLVVLVSYMFQDGHRPWPIWITNVNGDFACADIADLVYLVTYMFQDGPPLKAGPKWVTP